MGLHCILLDKYLNLHEHGSLRIFSELNMCSSQIEDRPYVPLILVCSASTIHSIEKLFVDNDYFAFDSEKVGEQSFSEALFRYHCKRSESVKSNGRINSQILKNQTLNSNS